MNRSRPALKWAIRVVLYGSIILIIGCGIFLHRGQQRLLDLVSHTSQKSTDVYSLWTNLDPKTGLTKIYIEAALKILAYEPVPDVLKRPGQYRVSPTTIEVWTRPFEFPDQNQPAGQVELTFWNGRLYKVESLPDRHSIPSWRLEPRRLARWAAKGGASQPQIHMEELPSYVPQAVIAIEDKRFFHHGAIDFRGLFRAVWIDLRKGELRQGGSTISQQLSRSIFLDIQRTLSRKLLEAGLAFYLEAFYTKNQLLEMYLNQVYWGQDGVESLIGLESASRSYFGKGARELTLSESATLAGMLQSPNHYSPRADLKIAQQRRNVVLHLMTQQGYITPSQRQAAEKESIKTASLAAHAGEAPYFVATLQDALLQKYSLTVLMTEGWQIFTTLDPVLQNIATHALRPSEGQGALVALDPKTGAVRAWVGGTNYGRSTYDRVIYARRQPGSAFKPIVMLAAIDSRKATEATMLEDKPLTVQTPQGKWSPQNYDRKYRNMVSLWDTLVFSLNVPAVRLAMQTGLDTIVELAQRMGITSSLRAVPSLALGTSEVTVIELTSAYATLANGGISMSPYTIETILDANKQIVVSHRSESLIAVSPLAAFIVTHMLQAVFEEGTAKPAREMGFTFPAAGKTGTSENYQDAWFIGYTPDLVCGVWVGYDQPKAMGRAAAGIALPVWVAFMQKALAMGPEIKWEEPRGLVWKPIDVDSGELARSGCTHRRKEAFFDGTQPEKLCHLHPGGLFGFFYRLKNRNKPETPAPAH